MPPKGWRKNKPSPPPQDSSNDTDAGAETTKPVNPVTKAEPKRPAPKVEEPTPPEPSPPIDDEEAEFVKPEDIRKMSALGQPPTSDKEPGQAGFIADLVAGAGQKLHEVEYGVFGHPVFQHTPADERIWSALGRYAESMLDPTKYGIVILLVVLVGSESMKLAVYAKWRADQSKSQKKVSK